MKALIHAPTLALIGLLTGCGGGAGNETVAANASARSGPAGDNMSNMAMPAMAKSASGIGIVKAVDKAAGTITLDHGPIPAAGWPAMTMTFKAVRGVIASAKEGEKVSFDMTLTNGGGEVTAIRKQ